MRANQSQEINFSRPFEAVSWGGGPQLAFRVAYNSDMFRPRWRQYNTANRVQHFKQVDGDIALQLRNTGSKTS
jgi:hypothetical protein